MISGVVKRVMTVLLCLLGLGSGLPVYGQVSVSVDTLLQSSSQYLNTAPEKSVAILAQLKTLQSTFSKEQEEKYYLISAVSLGFRGQHKERVELVESYITKLVDPAVRVQFLYHLSDGYSNLGDYERALIATNQSIELLPKLTQINEKIFTLQAAISLFNSLHAYSQALEYADRMLSLDESGSNSSAKCYGRINQAKTFFLQGNGAQGQSLIPEAIEMCRLDGRNILVLIAKTLSAIDLMDRGHDERGLKQGIKLLNEFSVSNQTSDYAIELEEAMARAYLKKADLQLAERYGLQAYQHAQNSRVLEMMEQSSESMAKIKRAQGNMASALDYYDINLGLKKKLLDDRLQKKLAYQRIKFDTQDKANQLSMLEQKNKILSTEKMLEQKNTQNLLMLITLGAILMAILLAWILKILRQKNLFRLSSQIDGLTQMSNRAHFVACAVKQFEKTAGSISVILFDLDHFKNVNDTFGHATGDWVLKAVSASVKALLPKAGILGRLGGEEFALCLPKFDQHQALALAERCRAAIAAIDSKPSGFDFTVTASFGVASRGMRDLKEFEDSLAAADKALYFSKTEGRNRVSLYQ